MLREEASNEKLGFGRNWETSAGAASGKRGKREDKLVVGLGSDPPPAEKPAAVVVVGGECSGESSMTACENRSKYWTKEGRAGFGKCGDAAQTKLGF
jgi:hypothetical protein